MKKIDIVGISFGNFRRRKLRSILTVLGVVIGSASIVTMMSLGIAINDNFNKSMSDMTDLTTVQVYPGYDESTGQMKGDLNDELVEQLKALDKVEGVSPEIQLSGKMISGKYQAYSNIVGIDMQYADKMGLKLAEGQMLDDTTVSSGKMIYAIFGSEAAYQFRDTRKRNNRGGGSVMYIGGSRGGDGEAEREPPLVDVMAEDARIRYTYDWSYGENRPGDTSVKKKPVLFTLKAVGVTSKQYDSQVYIDIETALRLKKEADKFNNSQYGGNTAQKQTKQAYDSIKVFAESMEDTGALTEEIKKMGLQAWSNGEYLSNAKAQVGMIQALLGGIGGISLLVAAIGIANTMVMSIYERTKEIGIMKCVGCYLKDIRTMFLVEAGFIGFFGGLVGVGVSYGLSFLMNFLSANGSKDGGGGIFGMLGMGGMGEKISVIPVWLALVAIGFSILVALISGFFPARRAMRLSALEAMKN